MEVLKSGGMLFDTYIPISAASSLLKQDHPDIQDLVARAGDEVALRYLQPWAGSFKCYTVAQRTGLWC